MRIFNWMQGKKANNRKGRKGETSNSIQDDMMRETHREELDNWPHGLLAIGTLGDENLNQVHTQINLQGNSSPFPHHHLQDLTPEDQRKLKKEFNLFLDEHLKQSSSSSNSEASKLFPNRQSSFKTETTKHETHHEELNEKNNESFQRGLIGKGKDACMEANDSAAIGKRTFSLLLKQIFVCRGGIPSAPVAPPPRIPILEPRMEKVMRTILHKKIYPQSSNIRRSSKKKHMVGRIKMSKEENKGEKNDKTGDGSKWDQTDSEYIVLEI